MQWWQWLLVVAGGFILAIFVLIVAAIQFLKYKLRGLGKTIGDLIGAMNAGVAIPQSANLIRATQEDLAQHDKLDIHVNEMKSLGLEIDGPFRMEEDRARDLIAYCLADPARSLMGMLMISKSKGRVLDFVTEYEDGMSCTHTTLEDQGMDKPEWVKFARLVGATPSELVERHLAERPQKPMSAVSIAGVPGRVKFYVEEEYFWRATRGGLTEAELDRAMALQPKKANDDGVETDEYRSAEKRARDLVRSAVRGQAQSFLQEKFHAKLLASLTMTPAEWEKIEDRLLFVHDVLDASSLSYYVEPPALKALPTTSETPAQAALRVGPIRTAFARLNDALPPEWRLELFQTVDIESRFCRATADVYLTRKGPDGNED
jgi:hypothetical protein